jgi:methylmalonyl-CoA mutase
MIERADFATIAESRIPVWPPSLESGVANLGRWLTWAELNGERRIPGLAHLADAVAQGSKTSKTRILGVTGTGGAGKSTLTDEILRRFIRDNSSRKAAVLAVDPTKRKTGGALLGDRIRMNSVTHPQVFMRSFATRGSGTELSAAVTEAIAVLKAGGFDLIIVETTGIGQGSSGVTDVCDASLYVMTPDFGAQSQLEKIDMIDYADVIVVNKIERQGGEDAVRDVRKQYRRSRKVGPEVPDEGLPVFGTIASQFNDEGVNAVYAELLRRLGLAHAGAAAGRSAGIVSRLRFGVIPRQRSNYLAQVADAVESYRKRSLEQIALARRIQALETAKTELAGSAAAAEIDRRLADVRKGLLPDAEAQLSGWPDLVQRYKSDQLVTRVRERETRTDLHTTSLSGLRIPRVALPKTEDQGEILKFLRFENVPGSFPYTAGVFPFKRVDEDPRRQFAGEGPPERTNRRFHFLCANDKAKRLSTAFDSVTLYGQDPDERPDIYGKIGESGVSICTLDDMKKLYAGFDLCDPNTSVSMTINGPAPIILAMFLNTAIDQANDACEKKKGALASSVEREEIKEKTLSVVRGTVQADILKEDQAQNTCIFSTEFALRMMGDIQAYFTANKVRNFYSVSISGYHIAEAGANPITQLAFTLANGFTYVEYYLSRGMHVDDFAPNLSFFFSNGLDPEYSVIGRVARRIWAKAMKHKYGANERSQKLKYHVQTSGRSLHAQEIAFNDIRTTLQALYAIYDNCNSLHTNAYDEAITTPTEESVRRALAIQLIINEELGLAKNENPLQGSFIVEELTDLVEQAVLTEFRAIAERGGVLGAMERMYQRTKIQEESLYYESMKHEGRLPVIGVNMFLDPAGSPTIMPKEVIRSTTEEKEYAIASCEAFQRRSAAQAPRALRALQRAAASDGNVFASLMEACKVCSLGQISAALYDVGGQYRRSM